VDEAVTIHNHLRPHQALGYGKPMAAHGEGDRIAA